MKVVQLYKTNNETKIPDLADMYEEAIAEALERHMDMHECYDKHNAFVELLNYMTDAYIDDYNRRLDD
jgi:hypothetical protein